MKRSIKPKPQDEPKAKRARTTIETVDSPEEKLNNALLDAARRGDEKAVLSLLEQGADPNTKNRWGETALTYCARDFLIDEYVNTAKILIEKGANVNAACDLMTMTPLHYAAIFTRTDMIRFLIANQANVNLKDYQGHTPLDKVLEGINDLRERKNPPVEAVVEILLAADTDISVVDKKGKSTLARMQERNHLAPLLFKHYHDLSLLPKMSSLKDIMAVKVAKLAEEQGQSFIAALPSELIEYTTLVTPLLESKRAIIRNNLAAYQGSENFQQSYKEDVEKNETKITP